MSSIKLKGSSSGEAIISTASDGSSVILDKKLDVQGNEIILDADADTSIHADTDDQIDFKCGGTDTMHMISGKVGIGTTAPAQSLHVKASDARVRTEETSGSTTFDLTNTSSGHFLDSSGANNLTINKSGAGALTLKTSNSERTRIDANGRLCHGTSDPASGGSSGDHLMIIDTNSSYANGIVYVLHGNNNAGTFFTSDSTYAGAIACSGSSTTYNTSSDYRLKENVNYSFDATNVIKSLKPCKFNFIGESETKTGFLAHEVSPYIEQAVHGTKDATKTYTDNEGNEQTIPDYQGIDLSQLVPTLVKTIQEQQAVIENLQSRVTTLEE
jgi:hypothetical protein